MIDQSALRAYVHSSDFLTPLRLPAGTHTGSGENLL